MPLDFQLLQNHPNPFNPTTKISYQLPTNAVLLTVKVFDVLGDEIETLVDEEKQIENFEVEFDGTGLSSGIYFCQLNTDRYGQLMKILL